jgi:hypothetical protein
MKRRVINKYVRDEKWKVHYFHVGEKCYYPKDEKEHLEILSSLNGDRINILQYSSEEDGRLSKLKEYLSHEETQNPPYEITIATSKRFKENPKRHSIESKTSLESQ